MQITHEMQLNELPFSMIRAGEKTVELRLNDEKRKRIGVGDLIRFVCRSRPEDTLLTRVRALHSAPSFRVLLSGDLYPKCGFRNDLPEEAETVMRQYYSAAEEESFGVLGIEIELL